MKKLSILLALSLLAIQAQADIAVVRSLMPAGFDIAGVQTAMLRGQSETEALQLGNANFLMRDFDADGVADIIVIVEQNPVLQDELGASCPKEDWESNCSIVYGERYLQFWKGQQNGQLFNLVSENLKVVRGADEGGVFGDPLVGLALTAKNSVVLSFYGGSAWRWSMSYTLQFRGNDFYLIGYDDYYGWNGDGRFVASSTNFLTGEVVKSSAKNGDSRVREKYSKIAVKPLVALPAIEPLDE